MVANKIVIISLFVLLLSACSDNDDPLNFEGHWFIVYDHKVGNMYWHITDKNHVQADHHDPNLTGQYRIVRSDDDHFILETDDYYNQPEIGKIVNWQPDRIEFSSGLKMIRLTGETESSVSNKEFKTAFSSSIWEYDLNGSTVTFYPSDSLNPAGYKAGNLIVSGDWNTSDRLVNWDLNVYDDIIVLGHSIDLMSVVTILIDNVSENEFTGRLFHVDDEMPIRVQRVSPADYTKLESLESALIASVWEAVEIENLKVAEPDSVYLNWYGGTKSRPVEAADIRNLLFTLNFMPDRSLMVYMDGAKLDNYNWEITRDSNYLFVYNNWLSQSFFAKLDELSSGTPALSLQLDYFLSNKEFLIPEEYLIFELRRQ